MESDMDPVRLQPRISNLLPYVGCYTCCPALYLSLKLEGEV